MPGCRVTLVGKASDYLLINQSYSLFFTQLNTHLNHLNTRRADWAALGVVRLGWALVCGALVATLQAADATASIPTILGAEVEQLLTPSGQSNFVLVLPENVVYRVPAGTSGELEPQPGDHLETGDQLRTGPAGKALLLGPDLAAGVADQSKVEVAGKDLVLRAGRVYGKTLGAVSNSRWVEVLGARVRAVGTEYLIELDASTQRFHAYVAAGQLELPDPSGQSVTVLPGQVGSLALNGVPTVGAASGSFEGRIGWKLHYPSVLDLDDLVKATGGPMLLQLPELSASLAAYRTGDAIAAFEAYPSNRLPVSNAEAVYRATLLLAAGNVAEARALLESITSGNKAIPGAAEARLGQALIRLANAVRFEQLSPTNPPILTTEWLAESYSQQFLGNLKEARAAALRAAETAPRFGPALARRAELEFYFGNRRLGRKLLTQALAATPRDASAIALRGFVQSTDRQPAEARASFSEAIGTDPRSGKGWLGLGLCLMCEGKVAAALRCLQVAVVQEPQRAEFRTHLAKAYRTASHNAAALQELTMTTHDAKARSIEEVKRAKELDPKGAFRSMAFPSACTPFPSKFYAGIAAGPAFVEDLDVAFSSELELYSPCEPDRPLQFANGLKDTVEFDVGARVDLGLGYRISRVVSLELQPSVIWASAPNKVVVADIIEPGYNYTLSVSRGEVELLQVPILVGAIARFPVSNRLAAYIGADVGVVFTRLQLGNLQLDCYNDEEYGTSNTGDDSGTDWAFAYQAKLGLEYLLDKNLVLGLGYQFLGTTDQEWHIYTDNLRTDAIYTHSVSVRLDFNF